MQQIFKDLRIIDLSSVLAGPSVATFFAELGATVIKYENKTAGGDVTRSWKTKGENAGAPVSAYWASINYGKEIRMADLTREEDRNSILNELQHADILITNFKAGDAEKFGLQPASLRKKFPGLIIGSIKGFSSQSDRVAYDVVLQAETGFMFMNGERESPPVKMPVAMMDILAAHQLKEGILCALIRRLQTGEGSVVECSLEKAGIASLANQASNYLMTGHIPQRMGSRHPNIAPYGEIFTCADHKKIVLAIGSDRQFQALCRILRLDDTAVHPDFADNISRVKNRDRLETILAPVFALETSGHWMDAFNRQHVPAGKIKSLGEVFASPPGTDMILEEVYDGMNTKRVQSVAFEISAAES